MARARPARQLARRDRLRSSRLGFKSENESEINSENDSENESEIDSGNDSENESEIDSENDSDYDSEIALVDLSKSRANEHASHPPS